MSSSKPSVAVCASVAVIVRASFKVGMMTEIGIAMTRQPTCSFGLFGLSGFLVDSDQLTKRTK
jgi:hypothetical protein